MFTFRGTLRVLVLRLRIIPIDHHWSGIGPEAEIGVAFKLAVHAQFTVSFMKHIFVWRCVRMCIQRSFMSGTHAFYDSHSHTHTLTLMHCITIHSFSSVLKFCIVASYLTLIIIVMQL